MPYNIKSKHTVYFRMIQIMEVEKELLIAEIENLDTETKELLSELIINKIEETQLQRDYASAMAIYEELSKEYQEIESIYNSNYHSLQAGRLDLLPRTPIKPNKKFNPAISGVLRLFLS